MASGLSTTWTACHRNRSKAWSKYCGIHKGENSSSCRNKPGSYKEDTDALARRDVSLCSAHTRRDCFDDDLNVWILAKRRLYIHTQETKLILLWHNYIYLPTYTYTLVHLYLLNSYWILKGDRHFKERDVISGRRPECNIHGLAIFVNLSVSELMLRYTNWIRLKLWKLFFSPRFIREKMCRK